MRIAIGSSHHGYQAKTSLLKVLAQFGHEIVDVGVYDSRAVDYPEIAWTVSEKVSRGEADRGILVGGTGIGMTIAANKITGVRAVPCHDDMTAEFSRRHNDANVLCLSSGLLSERLMQRITEVWLATPFDGGRHTERLKKIARLEQEGR
jgi:ribose 5-phosphate isomerase B